MLLLGGGQLLGSEVPVRRVHVQRAQLRRRRVPLKTKSIYLTILSRNADIGTRSTSNSLFTGNQTLDHVKPKKVVQKNRGHY